MVRKEKGRRREHREKDGERMTYIYHTVYETYTAFSYIYAGGGENVMAILEQLIHTTAEHMYSKMNRQYEQRPLIHYEMKGLYERCVK